MRLMEKQRLDVVVPTETRTTDHITVTARCRGNARRLTWLGVNRPLEGRTGVLRPSGGGVGIVTLHERFASTTAAYNAKGALSVQLKERGGDGVLYVICVYVPPTTARRRHWRGELFAWVDAEYRRVSALGFDAVVIGDANSRYRHFNGRHGVRHGAVGNDDGAFTALCDRLGLSPLHGRDAEAPAGATSRQTGGRPGPGQESDYILAPREWGGDRARALPLQPWDDVPRNATHRPVCAEITLRARRAVGGGAPAATAAHPHAPPPAAVPRPPTFIPDVGHKAWAAVAATIDRELDVAAAVAHDPAASTTDVIAALQDVIVHGVNDHLRDDTASARSRVYRRFHGGVNMPAHVVAAFEKARAERRRVRSGRRRRALRMSELVQLEARAHAAERLAQQRGRAFYRQWVRANVRLLEERRRRDAHGMHRVLQRQGGAATDPLLGASDDDIPDGADGTSAAHTFSLWHRNQLLETRPPAPGATAEAWLQYVPRAPGGAALAAAVTAQEVYLAVFPATKRLQFQPCTDDCVLCREYALSLDAWCNGVDGADAPQWRPHLKTSKAAGPDGVPAEALAWARPEAHDERFPYRMRVAGVIADALSRLLLERRVPPDFGAATTTPLLKAVKPGQVADRAVPAFYRGITVGNLLPKVLGLVLTARISHWAVRHGVIGSSQIGFMPMRGAEWHVFTLREVVRARLRAKLPAAALFIDLRKAYDMVQLSALWAVLRRMGLPAAIIDLLESWAVTRTARLRVNGVLSAPVPTETGVPQGDTLSPLLFNLFIESLSRYLDAQSATVPGIAVHGVTVRKLFYADDIVVLGGSAAELQSALSHVRDWCAAWHMEVNPGVGKTEAMMFRRRRSVPRAARSDGDGRGGNATAAAATPPPLPPLQYGDAAVQWVEQYKYLGYLIRYDLNEAHITGAMADKMDGNYRRTFWANHVVRGTSAGLQLQLLRTCVTGSVNYLRSLIELNKGTAMDLTRSTLAAARAILLLQARAPDAAVWSLSRLLTVEGVSAREHERLRLQFELSPFQGDLAPTLYRALRETADVGPAYLRSWVHAAARARADDVAAGAVASPPPAYWDIPRSAHVWGRSVAYVRVAAALHKKYPPPAAPLTAADRPAHTGPLAYFSSLHFGLTAPAAALGTSHGHTALSCIGPGCSGSLLAIADEGRYPSVASATLGPGTLQRPPFVDKLRSQAAGDEPLPAEDVGEALDAHEAGRAAPAAAPWAAYDVPCELCGGAKRDLYHAALECPAQELRSAQAALADDVPAMCASLLGDLRDAMLRARRPPPLLPAAEAEAAAAAAPAPSSDAERSFLTYRLLVTAPWPAAPARAAAYPLASAIGATLDAVSLPPMFVRPFARRWLAWSERHLTALGEAWKSAVAARAGI